MEDYFGEDVTGKNAIETVRRAWKTSKKEFVVNEKTNELWYNNGNTFDVDRLKKELPETLEARKSREWIVMNLTEARKIFWSGFQIIILGENKKQVRFSLIYEDAQIIRKRQLTFNNDFDVRENDV